MAQNRMISRSGASLPPEGRTFAEWADLDYRFLLSQPSSRRHRCHCRCQSDPVTLAHDSMERASAVFRTMGFK